MSPPHSTWDVASAQSHPHGWRCGGRGWRGADCTLHWAPAPQPWSVLNKGQPLGEGLRGPGENMERPGPEHKAGGGGGSVQKPQAETKVLSALLSGTEGFQPRALCPWSSSPAVQKECSWTKNRSCGLNKRPGPHRYLKAAPHLSIPMTMARGPGQPKTGGATQSFRLSPWGRVDTWLPKQGGHSPFQTVPLV